MRPSLRQPEELELCLCEAEKWTCRGLKVIS